MGQVKTPVHLTNVLDALQHRQSQVTAGAVRTYTADALVDTGTTRCVLPVFVVERLGLQRLDRTMVQVADGRLVEVDVTAPFFVELQGRMTVEDALVMGDQVLLGVTVLEKLDLLVDYAQQRLLPNPAHPDQPVFRV
jgi:clan AA aspartic protease